jgi:DNA-binding transcriptional LysR family regulator
MAANTPVSDESLLLRLRTRQLLLVALVGREQQLGRAAEAMGLTQPAATRLLRQAEDTLGARLFERQARGMAATPAGEVVIRYARQLLVDFGVAREQLAALGAGLEGHLRIGSVPGALPQLLAPALADYKRRHPRVAVSVVVETSDAMLERLRGGEVDLVLGRPLEGHLGDDLDSRMLMDEPQVVVAREGHPLLARKRLTLADLLQWPWVLQPPGSPQRTRLETALVEAGLPARLDMIETASTVATTALLAASDRLAIMPASLARHYGGLAQLKTLKVPLPLRMPSIHLVTRSKRALPPAAESFVRELLAGRR